MTAYPLLKNYNIKYLILLGNNTEDEILYDQIKLAIVEKLLLLDYPMFLLINKFGVSDKILKEAYAVVIIMKMKDDEYILDDRIIAEVLDLVSLDDLIHYGAESPSLVFRDKCIKKFWEVGKNIEDKIELDRKKNSGKVKLKKLK